MRDPSAVLEFDQGEEDVVLGRQCRVGCQSPSRVTWGKIC